MMSAAIPPLVYSLWKGLRPGTPLLRIVATTSFAWAGQAIEPGDAVLYRAPEPADYRELDGVVVAVSDGDRVAFGPAAVEGRSVIVGGKPYPRHMVRGLLWAVLRPVPAREAA